MQVFVPVEDAPSGTLAALLVPYQCGLVCEHSLREAQASEMWAHFAMNDIDRSRPHAPGMTDPVSARQAAGVR